MTRLAFVDTETTGLDPDRHEIWEVGLIVRDGDYGGDPEDEYRWFLPVSLGSADPYALRIGRFHERHPRGYDWQPAEDEYLTSVTDFAREFADLTRGCHLVGAVVSFDEERLRRLLRANGACPEWHYHLIDVENLAVGMIMGRETEYDTASGAPRFREGYSKSLIETAQPPYNSSDVSQAVGVNRFVFEEHTALGDARWARAVYDAVMNTQ